MKAEVLHQEQMQQAEQNHSKEIGILRKENEVLLA